MEIAVKVRSGYVCTKIFPKFYANLVSKVARNRLLESLCYS